VTVAPPGAGTRGAGSKVGQPRRRRLGLGAGGAGAVHAGYLVCVCGGLPVPGRSRRPRRARAGVRKGRRTRGGQWRSDKQLPEPPRRPTGGEKKNFRRGRRGKPAPPRPGGGGGAGGGGGNGFPAPPPPPRRKKKTGRPPE